MYLEISQEPLFTEIYRKKYPSPGPQVEHAQSHVLGGFARAHTEISSKRPQTKSKQILRRKLCASLRNQNTLGDFTRAT